MVSKLWLTPSGLSFIHIVAIPVTCWWEDDDVWRVWRYERVNQNPYIEEEQTTQWPKEKVQKDKQRSTKHTYKTKDRVTWTPLKTGGELRCSGRVSSSCSTSGTRRVNLVKHPVISREWGKDREVLRQVEHIRVYYVLDQRVRVFFLIELAQLNKSP